MKKILSFLTVLFLLASLIILIIIAIMDTEFLYTVANVIQTHLLISIFVLIVFLGLLSAGIVSNSHRIEGSLISNGYIQLAILELFLITAGLSWFRYYLQQPGQIVLRLSPGETKEYINVGLTFQSRESVKTDTVSAPGHLNNRPAGKYLIETLDPDIEYYRTEFVLVPAETEILVIPVALNAKSLAVHSEPTDAEIWIDGLHAANTPHTFEIVNRDTVILALKKEGYQTHLDTISLKQNQELGVISLEKLFALRVSCAYQDLEYRIYDSEKNMVFSGRGSRTVQLPKGNYKLAYEIGEGQYETRSITLDRNLTVNVQ
jgi:hypothetical protein